MMQDSAVRNGDTPGSLEQLHDRVAGAADSGAWDTVQKECDAYFAAGGHSAEAHYLNALSAFAGGDFAAALAHAQRAMAIDSNVREYAELLAVLSALVGNIQDSSYYGKLATALPSADAIGRLKLPDGLPDFSMAYLRIERRPLLRRAVAAMELGQWTEAENWFGQQFDIDPTCREACLGLAQCMYVQRKHRAAIDALRAAAHALPGDALIASNLGAALTAVGEFAEARACHRFAVAASDDPAVHAQAAIDGIHDPEQTLVAAAAQFRAWGERFGTEVFGVPPQRVRGTRRLTLGYVVGGVPRNLTAAGLARVLSRHDRERYRVVGFGFGPLSAPSNMVLQKAFEGWRDVRDMDPLTFGSVVRAEDVDILVDASGFNSPRLIAAFGARLAPLQVSWLGAPAGTGLAGMDAILSDSVMDPEEEGPFPYRENVARLALGTPVAEREAPVAGHGPMTDETVSLAADATLGDLNPTTVGTWARLLHACPNTKLVLRDHDFRNDDNSRRLIGLFGDFGVSHRVDFVSDSSNTAFVGQADICLMPFPASRLDVALEALSAGVPVICWRGLGRHHRLVASALAHMGFADGFLAASPEAYVELARSWVDDADRRRAARNDIVGRLEASAFFDPSARARDLEAVYDELWQRFGEVAG